MPFKIIKEEKQKKKTIFKSICFSKEFNEEIEKLAKENKVSFSKFVKEAVRYAIDNMEIDK